MHKHILLVLLLLGIVFISGCTSPRASPSITGTRELLLSKSELQQLGMTPNGEGCRSEEYPTSEQSPLAQYSFCNFTLTNLNTEVIIELSKFTNTNDLNGTYQYSSLHLRGFEGLINENEYGDFSRFYVNNESMVYYYHLWIGKNTYLIHITSKGSQDAKDTISNIGRTILSKFGE